jgi:hypothetical protein
MRTALLLALVFTALFACVSDTKGAQELVPVPYVQMPKSGYLAFGLVCRRKADLETFLDSSFWNQERPDPERALLEVKAAAHSQETCAWYWDEGLPVLDVVQEYPKFDRRGMKYLICQLKVSEDKSFEPPVSEYRYRFTTAKTCWEDE